MIFTQILLVLILAVLIIGFWDVVAIKLTKKDHELFDEDEAVDYFKNLNSNSGIIIPNVPTPIITMTKSTDIPTVVDPRELARKQAQDRVGH